MLAILGAHELGHYLACRYYRINASLPYFLPIPFPLTGTAGAFIRIRQPITTKRGAVRHRRRGPVRRVPRRRARAAPRAGDVARRRRCRRTSSGIELGEPLLFKAAAWLVWGDVPDELSLNLHPMAFAAWFGLLATALNLFPIGQFDGGHIAYAVLRPPVALRDASAPSASRVGLCVLLVVVDRLDDRWPSSLLSVFGWRHPPTWDDHVPLDRARLWLALVGACHVRALLHAGADRAARPDPPAVATGALSVPPDPASRPDGSVTVLEDAQRVDVDRRPCAGGPGVRAARRRTAVAHRGRAAGAPFTKNCARCSPRSRASGAGAGPEHRERLLAAGARMRVRPDRPPPPWPSRSVGAAHDAVDERDDRRVAHRAPERESPARRTPR